MPLIEGIATHAVCDMLQQVTRGHIKKLVINIPPGHAKSLLVSVLWPAWVWIDGNNPYWRALFGSYSMDLALRDSVRCRTLIDSPWYAQNFRDSWQMQSDMNIKRFYQNTSGGFRISLSVGTGTGYRGDAMVVDDPLNAEAALSKLKREEAIRWWDQTMSSRLNNLAEGVRVIIMQRLHEEDLTGHVLKQGGYEHLCLPSQFETKRKCTIYVKGVKLYEDPRTVEGELLFPALFPETVIKQARKDLGTAGFEGQHQQRPAPATGNMFQRTWWKFYRKEGTAARPNSTSILEPKRYDETLISVDATFKGGEDNDFVVIQVWGRKGADKFLLYQVRAKLEFTDTLKEFKRVCNMYPRAYRKVVEDKANGSAIINALKSEVHGMVPINPEGGKEARAQAISPQVESGNVYLPEDWEGLGDFIEEFAVFPRGKHDDQVDACSQALVNFIEQTVDLNRARNLANM